MAFENEGNPIARIRREKGLSIYDMGMLARVSASWICQIEHGDPMKIPEKVMSVVEALGYDPEEIQA